jgi:hypothetical protein
MLIDRYNRQQENSALKQPPQQNYYAHYYNHQNYQPAQQAQYRVAPERQYIPMSQKGNRPVRGL